jgi:DNA-binding GntR family transcriptional regulator
VLDRLRGFIVRGDLLPGEQIRQESMSSLLGVSRVPLREALRVLSSEGLLTHRPHQGYFVAKMSTGELEQIHMLLEFLETELIRTVRWPSDMELAELRNINAQFSAAAELRDPTAMNRLNEEFHGRIFGLSPLSLMRSETSRFWTLSAPYRVLHVAIADGKAVAAQHEQIIDAIAANDRALLLRASAEHRRDTNFAALNLLNRPVPILRDTAAS